MGFKINFPVELKDQPRKVAAQPFEVMNPAKPAPTDKPHYNVVDEEFFQVVAI